MSSAQHIASPRAPRADESARTASQTPPHGRTQRRPRGNRAHNNNPATGQHGVSGNTLPGAQVPALAASAVFSGEQVAMLPAGPRPPKKHTRSQPSADRAMANSSFADADLGPVHATTTPAKAQGAYAGPTFHASPAPSALPIPKFLSKSVPPKSHRGPPTPPPEEGSDSSSSPSPSPSRAPIPIPSRPLDSPLDMLFKADRAEKARNGSCSPLSARFSPLNATPSNGGPQHAKQGSFTSLNAPFPIELEANNKTTHNSPPVASPAAHRSATAPSKIPQIEALAQPKDGPGAIQDLLNRLSISQNKAAASTPPKTTEHGPSDATMRDHTPSPRQDGRPSPFRSASGPTTPVPSSQTQEFRDSVYGNGNLTPMFKAAKQDPAKRNSGLRTEITAHSPIMPQDEFPELPPRNTDVKGLMGVLNGPAGPRRGSAPQIHRIPPYQSVPNNQHMRSPGRHPHHPRPDSYPYGNGNGTANGATTGMPPPPSKSSAAMAFIPSSVRAKPQTTTSSKTVESDKLALEQNLKRMLNLTAGETNGVR